MTIAIRGAVQAVNSATITHSAVAGIVAGDLYLDLAHNTGGGVAPILDTTYPFTTIATGTDGAGRNYTYGRRVATGAETGLTTTGPNYATCDFFLALSGIDTTTPIESYQEWVGYGTTTTVPASTPTKDNCWHVILFADSNSDATSITTPPAGYTALSGSPIAVSSQGKFYAYYKDLGAGSSGVSTGAVSAVWTGGTAGGVAAGFIVRSAGGGGGGSSDPAASSSRFNTSRHTFGTRR